MSSKFNFSTPSIELTSILNFCSWQDRINVGYLNKRWNSFTHSREYFKMMCNQLEIESGVYVPPVSQLPITETWEQLFHDLFKLRKMWLPLEENNLIPSINNINGNNIIQTESSHWRNGNTTIGEVLPFEPNIIRTPGTGINKEGKYKITVFARFKPPTPSIEDINSLEEQDKENNTNMKEVSLPLHQRLSMIKMSHKNTITNRDALKILASEGGWFSTKWSNIEQSKNGNSNNNDLENNFISKQNIPKMKKNIDKNSNKIIAGVQSINSGTGSVVMITPDVGLREFNFEGVFNQKTTQSKLYEESARRLICDFINGFNATILVYGQTGSGKTFSMFGPDDKAIYGNNISQRGIIPRTCAEILTAIEKRRESFTIDSQMSVSYVEIFGDAIFDLLKNGEKCGHSKVSAQRYVLHGAAEQRIHDLNDISIALKNGELQKRKASTAMNERSSRAHAVFIITLRQTCIKTGVERSSKLFLADLGGSESVKKSKVDTGKSNTEGEFSKGFELGDRMREAVNINLGLLALKKCIECLNNGSRYIPFQDSKLTMLLSEGLGGNSKTSVIVCGSMDSIHANETISSLRFGEKCGMVENIAKNNNNMLASVLENLDIQIKNIEKEILLKEKWQDIEKKRSDINAEEGTLEAAIGGVEIIKMSVLVGAEIERKELETLLRQRSQFTGGNHFDEDNGDDIIDGIENINLNSNNVKKNKKVKKTVQAFGKGAESYGLGDKFDVDIDAVMENNRFAENVDEDELPDVIRLKSKNGKSKQWRTADKLDTDGKKLEETAKKVNRSKLVYSGISA